MLIMILIIDYLQQPRYVHTSGRRTKSLRLPERGKAHRLVVVVMINVLSLEEDCEYSE